MLRKATYADIPRLFEIRLGVRENKLPSPTFVTVVDCIRFIDESGGFWVWEEGGRVLGFSAPDTRDGSVWALFVDPMHEGRGIGRALLRAACATLAAHFEYATLSTGPGTRADRFYRADCWIDLGFNERAEVVFRKRIREIRPGAAA